MRKHIGLPLALLTFVLAAAEARAQVIYFPPPDSSSVNGNGDRYYTYYRRGVRISGVFSSMSSFGPVSFGRGTVLTTSSITAQAIVTPIVSSQPPGSYGGSGVGGLAGVDLDMVRPSRRFGVPAEKVAAPAAPAAPLPSRMPGVDVSTSKPSQRPEDNPPPAPKPAPPAPPPAKPPSYEDQRDPDDPWRLMDLGRAAFSQQQYGQAAWRFRQAAEAAPNLTLSYFLQAQAEFALGKHRLAARTVEAGMRRKPDWPEVKTFRPRLDLYKGNEAAFDAHLTRLADALKERPQDGDLLFLYAYQLWFDGQRAEAQPYFERARALAADPTFIDRFLQQGGWKVVSK